MKILYTFLIAVSALSLQGQNVLFSFEVDYSMAPDAIVTVLASTASGTEDLSTFTTAFYFEDTNSDFDPASGWAPAAGSPFAASSTITSAENSNTNADVVGYDTRIEVLADDPTFTGILVGTDPVELYTLTFTDVIEDGLEDFYIGAADTEGATAQYLNPTTFAFHDVVTTGERAASLPVILKSFVAEKHTNSSTIVRWTSSSEINASHYEVERSTDQATWSFVGKVSAVGNSSVEQSYDLLDRDLNLNSREDKKIYYYRLKMVDLDGAYEYSPVDAVSFDAIKVSGMFVYPNPTVQDVFVTLEHADNAVLRVVDRNGKVVLTQKVVTGQDERVVLSNLPSGVYMLSLIQNDEVQTQQVIKMD